MQLNYKSFGQGDPVIILHGLFGSLDNWQTIAKTLAEKYTVFIVDLRNHGRSPHMPEHNYRVMADDIQTFMSDNWIYGSHVIGHSMGGKVAMRLALDYPEMVNKLVVVDMGVKPSPSEHHDIFEAMLGLDVANLASRKVADEAFKKRIPQFSVRQFLLKNLARASQGYQWKMNLPAIYENYDEISSPIKSLDTFDNPTLFLRGGNSKYVLDEDFDHIKSLFPDARLATIDGVGHWLHAEAPDAFLKIVGDFLG